MGGRGLELKREASRGTKLNNEVTTRDPERPSIEISKGEAEARESNATCDARPPCALVVGDRDARPPCADVMFDRRVTAMRDRRA